MQICVPPGTAETRAWRSPWGPPGLWDGRSIVPKRHWDGDARGNRGGPWRLPLLDCVRSLAAHFSALAKSLPRATWHLHHHPRNPTTCPMKHPPPCHMATCLHSVTWCVGFVWLGFGSWGGATGVAPLRSCSKLPRLQVGPTSGQGRANQRWW